MSNSGRIELFPVQQQLGVHLESVAVEDLELAKPTYRPLRAFNLEVAPNQHVYLKARPTGVVTLYKQPCSLGLTYIRLKLIKQC